MSRTLVFGANGFIGSHLVDSLVERGHSVRAFDRFSTEPKFNKNTAVEIFRGDFLNQADLRQALKDIDYVFHFISMTTPATAEDDPVIDIQTNVRTSVELFKLCVDEKIRKVFYASSGGTIYGESEQGEKHKETDPLRPISPYAIGKLSIENYLRYFKIKRGLDSTVFRIANPYGERQALHSKQGVIPIFLENIYQGLPITILGDGSMVRDYIYVKDVASMIVDVFEKPNLQEVYNLGSGEGKSINEIIDVAREITGDNITINYKPSPATFVKSSVLDMTRFEDEFHLRAITTLQQGMNLTYKYIRSMIEGEKR